MNLKFSFYLDSIDGVQEFLFAEIRHAVKVEVAEGGADGRRQPASVVHVVDKQKFRPAQITRRTVKNSFNQRLIISKIQIDSLVAPKPSDDGAVGQDDTLGRSRGPARVGQPGHGIDVDTVQVLGTF